MKKILLSRLSIFWAATSLHAQAAFNTMDSVNINNINASVLVHGDMWWRPDSQTSMCFFPNGTHKNIGFASALWMSAYDAAGKLHVAAQTYRQDGNDYWPGPLDASDTLTYATSQQWAKIWKVNRTDIQYFESLSTHTTGNTPSSILTWPGAGNIYAVGSDSTPLVMVAGYTYAPFVDLNGNGIYEPLLGEYPDVPGDQALWWVFSDNGPTHNQSKGRPLDVEVHAMSYAYKRGTLIDNVVYYKYEIINRGSNSYNHFRLAQWANMDLGYYMDDFIGFDSSHRLGIIYNGTDCDGCSAGYPPNSYGTHIPVAGITMVSLPGDSASSYVPAGAFTYYNNDFSIIGNPTNDTQIYNYMQGGYYFRHGYFSLDTTGADSFLHYAFSGDPGDTTSWSECTMNDNPGDRRFILSSNDFTALPGSINEIIMALVTTNLDSPNGCPHVSFDSIKIVTDTAWADYYNPPAATTSVPFVAAANIVGIYPNPAHDKLYVSDNSNQNGDAAITIFNTLGQAMNVSVMMNSGVTMIDIGILPSGIYYLSYRGEREQKNYKFIKE